MLTKKPLIQQHFFKGLPDNSYAYISFIKNKCLQYVCLTRKFYTNAKFSTEFGLNCFCNCTINYNQDLIQTNVYDFLHGKAVL